MKLASDIVQDAPSAALGNAWSAMRAAYRADEAEVVATLRSTVAITPQQNARIAEHATQLAAGIRERAVSSFNAEAFLGRYRLSTREGVVLMCLAEAFLRIPDERTRDELLRDKLSGTDWSARADDGPLLLNASAWGLMLSGKLASWQDEPGAEPWSLLKNLVARVGEPLVRAAIKHAMRIMAEQFVIGETIAQAVARTAERGGRYTYSFDMLGEAARTRTDAERYFESYREAINVAGAASAAATLHERPGISVKLSALHPRYEVAKKSRVMEELLPRLHELAMLAKSSNVSLTVDAEESERLALSLTLFEQVLRDSGLGEWPGFGLAVQAYQKRAFYTIEWLQALAAASRRRITVRLVKGAYWDTEIKFTQQQGVADYPVFTRKAATDLAYLACAQKLLAARSVIYPQFATHNSRSLATILELTDGAHDFEFQKLYGMGDALYEQVLEQDETLKCRVYAPVGRHQELLPYLVRRILENGANSSFVHQIGDPDIPLAALVADPLAATAPPYKRNAAIPLPPLLYAERKNSRALDLSDEHELEAVAALVAKERAQAQAAAASDAGTTVREPADTRCVVGIAREIDAAELDGLIAAAEQAAPQWGMTAVESRAALLERAADLMEQRMLPLMSLCVREAGKTIPDAQSEVREAVDYCRYYALRARRDLAAPLALPGPTGESNQLTLHPRGVFACISPWNFPLAIFTGQVAVALAAGNAVVAKPAEQTPLIAQAAVALLHEAGVPRDVLQLACGSGTTIGAKLVAHRGIAGVVFTGSVDTARVINQSLAARPGPIIPLIAETGGQNAMIVDSSALAEQVVADAVVSAFNSAGQRCSALRLLFLQDEIAPRVIGMLRGATLELELGDPAVAFTDIGPVIDAEAQSALLAYISKLKETGTLIAEAALPTALAHGHYVAPVAVEIGMADIPDHEVFGPVLHVIRYRADELDRVLAALNNIGYALTLGIQSRIDRFTEKIRARFGVGNTYVNRNMIGAVVGVQPFGGERVSGTGPKAGGPYYLPRFVVERTLTVNTAAVGGNANLLSTSGQ